MTAELVLVDAHDRPIGVADKLGAHQPPGRLHRALSGFVVNTEGHLLLQQRAATKHHFAGRWSNSFCTHPRPGEPTTAAGERRIFEELGIGATLRAVGSFTYRATDPVSGLVEHEIDHVLVGQYVDEPSPDPDEVGATRVTDLAALDLDLKANPDRYTPWLAPALAIFRRHQSDPPAPRATP